MRDSLYFKDDDSRLSFLFGNYITLTNLSERDAERIIKMHISPVNVSVHTMNEELRVKMMKNKNAGRCLSYLKRFAENGIKLNTQLVLCPGINDGKELEYSLSELSKLYPAVSSIAAVPVGLTKHREGLYPLCEYTKETAKEVIDIIEKFGNDFKEKHGTRLAYASDEFYLKAELPLPEEDYYEDYPQIENGVGLWKSLESEFMSTLSLDKTKEYDFTLSIATGTAAYPLIKKLTEALNERYEKARVNVYEIKNDFFGHSITVAGLITGKDLISQLKGKELGERLLIPEVMLRSERDMFLDNVTVEEAEKELNIKIEAVSNDGFDLYDTITN
jgi:putative radical SAM enzyme (TIGR03279 family)